MRIMTAQRVTRNWTERELCGIESVQLLAGLTIMTAQSTTRKPDLAQVLELSPGRPRKKPRMMALWSSLLLMRRIH
jgi:hypothetical protein